MAMRQSTFFIMRPSPDDIPSVAVYEHDFVEVSGIEKNIADLEKQIELIPKQKELVLNKYLE